MDTCLKKVSFFIIIIITQNWKEDIFFHYLKRIWNFFTGNLKIFFAIVNNIGKKSPKNGYYLSSSIYQIIYTYNLWEITFGFRLLKNLMESLFLLYLCDKMTFFVQIMFNDDFVHFQNWFKWEKNCIINKYMTTNKVSKSV